MSRYWSITLCFLTSIWLMYIPLNAHASRTSDSLFEVWRNKNLSDSLRLHALSSIGWEFLNSDTDSAYVVANMAYTYAKAKKLPYWEANALNTMGAVFYIKGDYPRALKQYMQSLAIKEKLGDQKSLAKTFNNIGLILQEQGSYAESLKYYYKSLRIKEKLRDKQGIAITYSNIGMIYQFQKRHAKALDYHFKSLDLETKLNNLRGIADCYNNIGVIYDLKHDYVKATKYFLKSLSIRERINDRAGMADSYTNIGYMFTQLSPSDMKKTGMAAINRFDKSLEYYNRALNLYQELGEERGISIIYSNIGKLENERKNYSAAANWCKRAFDIAGKIGALSQQVEACSCIYESYKGQRDGMKALTYMEKYIALRDTLINSEQEKKILFNEFQYEYDKKASRDSIVHAEAQRRKDLEISRQKALAEEQRAVVDKERLQKYMLWGGISLVIIFSVFIYNRLRIIGKQKLIIEQQKKDVDEKNRDITDSITYAQRIQEAMLPEPQRLTTGFADSFVLFKPRDLVSGDFYWYYDSGDIKYLCVADCTGHGVPGALMSMMGTEILNAIVLSGAHKMPFEILTLSDEYLKYALTRRGNQSADGMDMAMISWNKKTNELYFAGANRPLLLVRNKEMTLYPGSHAGIGGGGEEIKTFKDVCISTKPGDSFYLYSDGYHDQFGGAKGKKFMSRNFTELLCTLSVFPMKEQRARLEQTFTEWKGTIEQIDDVCVVGVKV